MDRSKWNRDRKIWDCDSSLYDSFELISFNRQLDSALLATSTSRCLSMPRLSDPVRDPVAPCPKKGTNKALKSVRRLIRSVFRSNKSRGGGGKNCGEAGMSPIAEEYPAESGPVGVRKTVSERFTGSIGTLRL